MNFRGEKCIKDRRNLASKHLHINGPSTKYVKKPTGIKIALYKKSGPGLDRTGKTRVIHKIANPGNSNENPVPVPVPDLFRGSLYTEL